MKTVLKFALVLVSMCTMGASVVTTKKGPTVLHPATGASTTFSKDTPDLSTHDQCMKAVQDLVTGAMPTVTAQCWDSTIVTAQATCEDVQAPHTPLVAEKQADGSTFWRLPDSFAKQVDDDWVTLQNVYVHSPAWPQGFPDCWVRGDAPESEWRVNGTDPAAPFLEKRVPGMAELPDGPLSVEPYYLPGEEPPPASVVPPA